MKHIILILFSLFFISCSQPDPKPELRDKIYQDLTEQKGLTEKALVEAEKQLQEHEKALKETTPQTGQIKWAEKRYFEAKNNLDKLKQQIKYFDIKIVERAKFVRRNYIEKFQKGENWENEDEVNEYLAEKKLRSAKISWDNKKRMEDAGYGKDKKKEKGGEGGSEKKSEGHGGGH